jgi:hypothetical protein
MLEIPTTDLNKGKVEADQEDAIVCFCYRLTTGVLKEA